MNNNDLGRVGDAYRAFIGCADEAASASSPEASIPSRKKASYVGAPAIFALQTECREIARAFGGYGVYLVGSATERPDWRDIDVRMILKDAEFERLFPDAGPVDEGRWEFNPRWSLITVAVSTLLTQRTGLPVDFQIQPRSHANSRHKGHRHCLCMDFEPTPKCDRCGATPVRTHLDGDDLCQSCADAWVRAEGAFVRDSDASLAEDAAARLSPEGVGEHRCAVCNTKHGHAPTCPLSAAFDGEQPAQPPTKEPTP